MTKIQMGLKLHLNQVSIYPLTALSKILNLF
ncbi:hypothetical protein KL86SPO_30223 [uncultured Sporomusa sp.]|uniref:Uncharacterized protein n=1 Tax=uncultured Sporomusa sp. TaxID=307249 RepID=A0A212LR23_9FIRM|nr:hypothetical protein KL86SPO_30223 [uncultured Sporomusa sp.]